MLQLSLAIIGFLVAAAASPVAPQAKKHSDNRPVVPSELTGQVFIATRSGESIKLGGIEVSAIGDAEMTSFIEKRKALIDPTKASLERELERSKLERVAAEKAYDKAKADSDAYRGGDVDETMRLFRVYSDAGSKKAWASGVEASDQKKLWSFPTAEFFYDGLPEAVIKTITDADGRFSVALSKGKYAIAAHASRQVGNERVARVTLSIREEYYWLVWVTIGADASQRVLLTNGNLMTSKSPASIFSAGKASFLSSN